MLLLLSAITGLLFMHGVQSSANPTDVRGVPLMTAMTTHEHGAHAARHSCESDECDGHRHPAGQMCLALLVLGFLLLVTALLVRAGLGRTTPPGSGVRGPEHRCRPPPRPSIFQLSVLRL